MSAVHHWQLHVCLALFRHCLSRSPVYFPSISDQTLVYVGGGQLSSDSGRKRGTRSVELPLEVTPLAALKFTRLVNEAGFLAFQAMSLSLGVTSLLGDARVRLGLAGTTGSLALLFFS